MVVGHMAMESCILKMMIYWKAFLYMGDVKAKGDLLKVMEVIMKEILKIMLQMVMEYMLGGKDFDMRVNGKIMFLMVQARQLILMGVGMLANFWIIRKMEKELYIKMAMYIVENSKMIILMGNWNIKVKMKKLIKVIGNKVKSMDMEFIIGQMEAHIKANMLMGNDMAKEKWYTLMVKYIKGNGLRAKSMEKDTLYHKNKISLESGKMEI